MICVHSSHWSLYFFPLVRFLNLHLSASSFLSTALLSLPFYKSHLKTCLPISHMLRILYFNLFVCSSIRSSKVTMDGPIISVKLTVNPLPEHVRNGSSSGRKLDCVVDSVKMKYDPVKFRIYHMSPMTSLRKMLWHEDDLVTDVSR